MAPPHFGNNRRKSNINAGEPCGCTIADGATGSWAGSDAANEQTHRLACTESLSRPPMMVSSSCSETSSPSSTKHAMICIHEVTNWQHCSSESDSGPSGC